MLSFPLPPRYVAPTHIPTFFGAVTAFFVLNSYYHCGYMFKYWELFFPYIFINSSAFHNVHHEKCWTHYGEISSFGDYLFGTSPIYDNGWQAGYDWHVKRWEEAARGGDHSRAKTVAGAPASAAPASRAASRVAKGRDEQVVGDKERAAGGPQSRVGIYRKVGDQPRNDRAVPPPIQRTVERPPTALLSTTRGVISVSSSSDDDPSVGYQHHTPALESQIGFRLSVGRRSGRLGNNDGRLGSSSSLRERAASVGPHKVRRSSQQQQQQQLPNNQV